MRLSKHLERLGLTDAEAAAELGVSDEMVRLWRHGIRRVAAHRAVQFEQVLGIPRSDLRPDLWPRPVAGSEAA